MLLDLFMIAVGIAACTAAYRIVARGDFEREQTATDEMWSRPLEHYRPKASENQKGAGDESPDALERCAERDVSEPLEDTLWI